MKIRAAVLEEFGAAARRAGGRPRRAAARARCSSGSRRAASATPTSTRRRAPTRQRLRADRARPRGRRRRRAGRRGRHAPSEPGDHVVTLFSPQCGECVHCLSPSTNLCLAIRDQQGQGYLPDGTTRLSRDGEPIRHFMGCSTFAEYTVMPEIALAKVNPEAPLDRACLFACGLSTGLGRGAEHRQGRGRARRASSSAPGWSASARSPAAASRAPSGSCASTSREDRLELGTRPGRDRDDGRRRRTRSSRSSR